MSNKTEHLFIDGIDVSNLSEKEVNGLLEAEDEEFMDSLSTCMQYILFHHSFGFRIFTLKCIYM